MLVDSRGAAAEEDDLRGASAAVVAVPLFAPDDFLWAGFLSLETRRAAWKTLRLWQPNGMNERRVEITGSVI